jgi:capsid protein
VLARAVSVIPLEAYAVDTPRYEMARFKPRGWSWIDPNKEVDAYIKAVRAGFTTTADVIAKTGDGSDLEDVLEGREQELAMMKDKGLVFDTDPGREAPKAKPKKPDDEEPPGGGEDDEEDNPTIRPERVVPFRR